MPSPSFLFERVAVVGIGLIGASMASAMKAYGGAKVVVAADANETHLKQALELEVVDEVFTDPAQAVCDADLVVLCVPVGAMESVARSIAPHLKKGCIVTDVGSVKQAVIDAVLPVLPTHVVFIPGHPIAGAAESGPGAGFAELFQNHYIILTPLEETDEISLSRMTALWKSFGAKVEIMAPDMHDRVLAVTSHLPHFAAFGVTLTAGDMEDKLGHAVIRYSAGGFRDVTRIAASDAVMWRDVFLNNREAMLEVTQLFAERLGELHQAIKDSDGVKLEALFTRARQIKRETKIG